MVNQRLYWWLATSKHLTLLVLHRQFSGAGLEQMNNSLDYDNEFIDGLQEKETHHSSF